MEHLSGGLDRIAIDKDFELHYERFVSQLVFGEVPEFKDVMDNFVEMADKLVNQDNGLTGSSEIKPKR